MRAVFINSCHPDTSHVCGLRARSFAEAMAARGHQIVLLTPPLEETGNGDDVNAVRNKLETHDWRQPCRVIAPYRQSSRLPRLRRGDFPGGLRQALIGLHYLRYGSVFEDWCAGVRPLIPAICETFRPDVVWAILGHTGCWRIGQEFASRASCPWVMDVKDSWTAFIPAVFRQLLARRFKDTAHITALSAAHASLIQRWIPGPQQTVVHSGVPASFVTDQNEETGPDNKSKSIFLCGSIYEVAHLAKIYSALGLWLDNHASQANAPIRLIYAGADTEKFMSATRSVSARCSIEPQGHLVLDQLHAGMSAAAINLHLYFPPVLFHHKLFELIAANRPILSFPGESNEAQNIADAIGARLYRCTNNEQLLAAFDKTLGADTDDTPGVNTEKLAAYSWDGQAAILEETLEQVMREG